MRAEIKSVQSVFTEFNLHIPNYQRPYRWQSFHVRQLLGDLLGAFHKNRAGAYRLGSIILHTHDGEKSDIVDGQQRLVTLGILLHAMGSENSRPFLEKQEFAHTESQANIIQNNRMIHEELASLSAKEKTDFLFFVENLCELMMIRLNELDDAFQFFDSQNSRGKPLQPYDLLKAHHLHAMPQNHHQTLALVERWERAVQPPEDETSLETIISYVLFRLRRWHHQEDAEIFSRKHIDLFKGVKEDADYPYIRQQRAAYTLYRTAQQNPMAHALPPFQIHAPLLDGEFFFEYIEHYRRLYSYLFGKSSPLMHIQLSNDEPILQFLNTYDGHWRKGDRYLRRLFDCTVLAYFDRFGDSHLDKAAKKIFAWVYVLRLQQESIWFQSVENMAIQKEGFLKHIELSHTPEYALRFPTPPLPQSELKNSKENLTTPFKSLSELVKA